LALPPPVPASLSRGATSRGAISRGASRDVIDPFWPPPAPESSRSTGSDGVGATSTCGVRSARGARSPRGARGARRGASASICSLGCCPTAVSAPPPPLSASSRYGLSPVSAFGVLGRFPRPRRGGRRRSFMPLSGKKVNLFGSPAMSRDLLFSSHVRTEPDDIRSYGSLADDAVRAMKCDV
jgi:hypothetical protein